MTEHDGSPENDIRRVGQKDRKTRLEARAPLFSDEELSAIADVETPDATESKPDSVASASAVASRPKAPATPAPKPRRNNWAYNLGTVFFALATIGAIVYFGMIAVNPYSPLNPLPPFTPIPIIVTTTPLPATLTPSPTALPTESPTPLGMLPITPTIPAIPFAITSQETDIDYQAHTGEEACDWSALQVTVMDEHGASVANIELRVKAEESDFEHSIILGSDFATAAAGIGAVVPLGDEAEFAAYTIQLFSLDGIRLSEPYTVITSDQCDQNVLVVTFSQVAAY